MSLSPVKRLLEESAQTFMERGRHAHAHLPRAVIRRIRRRQATVAIGTALASLAVLGGFYVGWRAIDPRLDGSASARDSILDVPPRAGAAPDQLADGRPVFVIRHDDGSINVVDAITSPEERTSSVVWWCNEAKTLEDPVAGLVFDQWGRSLIPKAPGGLASYRIVESAGNTVHVDSDQAQPAAPRDGMPRQRGSLCDSPREAVFHRFELTHTSVRAAHSVDGWSAVYAVATARPGRVVICGVTDAVGVVPGKDEPRYYGGRDCATMRLGAGDRGAVVSTRPRLWLMEIAGGRIQRLVSPILAHSDEIRQ